MRTEPGTWKAWNEPIGSGLSCGCRMALAVVLAENGLGHLQRHLAGLSLTECVAQTSDSRPTFLSALKSRGIHRLADRQAIANAVAKAGRGGLAASVSASAPLEETSVTRPVAECGDANQAVDIADAAPPAPTPKIWVVSDLHTDHTANFQWLQSLPTPPVPEDVLVISGDIASSMHILEATLSECTRRYARAFPLDLTRRHAVDAEHRECTTARVHAVLASGTRRSSSYRETTRHGWRPTRQSDTLAVRPERVQRARTRSQSSPRCNRCARASECARRQSWSAACGSCRSPRGHTLGSDAHGGRTQPKAGSHAHQHHILLCWQVRP